MTKLFEKVKTPTGAIMAIALVLVGFLMTTVVGQQREADAQHVAIVATLAEHDKKASELVAAIEELLEEQKYANSVSIKLLREVCYSSARNDEQRRRCVDLR